MAVKSPYNTAYIAPLAAKLRTSNVSQEEQEEEEEQQQLLNS